MVQELNEHDFKEITRKGLVLVDFWAPWCGPCRMLTPVFEEVSHDFVGQLIFAKLSTEEFPDLASEVGVNGIPCLILFKDGVEVDRIVGFQPKDVLKKNIERILNKV